MKRWFAPLLLAFVLVFVAACSNSQNNANTNSSSNSQSQSSNNQTQQNESPSQNQSEQSEDVDYPNREIRVIVPYSAGGTSDIVARAISDTIRTENIFNKTMYVTNIPSGGTVDGLKAVKDAEADGYTLLLHHTGFLTGYHLGIVPWEFTEFDTIAQVAEIPNFLVVHRDAPWNTVEDLVKAMKEKPGEITVSIPSIGASTHFTYEMFAKEAGVEGRLVVTGGAEQLAAILGKHVDIAFSAINQFLSEHAAGNVKILAMASDNRLEHVPDVPTFIESGYDVVSYLRLGLFGPKGLPDGVKKKLEDAAKQVTETASFQEFAKQQAIEVVFRDMTQFEQVMKDDDARIKEVAQIIKEMQSKQQ